MQNSTPRDAGGQKSICASEMKRLCPPMTDPIVFIHRGAGGDFNYLNYAALQARLSNPDAAIYVIGDKAARESLVVPGVELVPLEGLADRGLPLRTSMSITG